MMPNSPEFYKKPKENLYMAFRSAAEKCCYENIDMNMSGSTISSCYFVQNKIYCANAGDSRCVMGVKDQQSGKWTAKALSTDHKPLLASEAQRIWRCGGRIEPMKDNFGKWCGNNRKPSWTIESMA